jgi:hypothetical protein
MRPVLLLACVLSVGACTYAVDHINHKRAKKEGYASVFPAARNAIVAGAVGMMLAFVAQTVNHSIPDAPAVVHPQYTQYTDDTHIAQLMQQTVVADRVPRRPAHVDA